jgi:ketopantoate reductase
MRTLVVGAGAIGGYFGGRLLEAGRDVTFVRPRRIEAIGSEFSAARFEAGPSNAILQEMWEKWVFIAASAGITCLMRAAVGDIVAAGAADLAATLFAECAAIAAKEGFSPRPEFAERTRAHKGDLLMVIDAPGSLATGVIQG